MMEKVAQNQFYELAYDPTTNWVHWTMRGYWPNMAAVPNFEADWDTIQRKVKPGFKILADISQLKVMPDDVKNAQDKRQQKLLQEGCLKVAALIESSVTKISMNEALRNSGMDKVLKYCTSRSEAETFLKAP
jgi:hypothetical protein